MGLLDQVMQAAISDPDRKASTGDLGQIFSVVQQMSQQGNANQDTMQQAVSIVGKYVRSSLQETRNSQGEAAAQRLVQEGSQSGAAVLSQLFNGQQQEQLVNTVTQRTGLNASQVQSILPMLIPVVMQLLNQGATKQPGATGNTVLNAFLDADGDGDVDMGDMLSMAGRFSG